MRSSLLVTSLLFAVSCTEDRPAVPAAGSSGIVPPDKINSNGSQSNPWDMEIVRSAQRMLDDGRQIFRYDTFGSEAFWGDTLKLHAAIAGEKNGGVGKGVS